MLNTGIVKTGV